MPLLLLLCPGCGKPAGRKESHSRAQDSWQHKPLLLPSGDTFMWTSDKAERKVAKETVGWIAAVSSFSWRRDERHWRWSGLCAAQRSGRLEAPGLFQEPAWKDRTDGAGSIVEADASKDRPHLSPSRSAARKGVRCCGSIAKGTTRRETRARSSVPNPEVNWKCGSDAGSIS